MRRMPLIALTLLLAGIMTLVQACGPDTTAPPAGGMTTTTMAPARPAP